MYSEEELVPFRTTDLTGKKVLAIAPHPDDETFGCGGSLALHALAGDPVKVVFLTNGARGETSGETEKDSYVKIRQEEARRACECLGVKDLEFWGYEDRGLAASPGASIRLAEFLKTYEPQLVYTPSVLEFHPDHRATAFLVGEALRACDLVLDVAFYEVGQPLGVNCLVDITPVLNLKIRAADEYSSQLRERPYKDVALALNRFRSLTLPRAVSHAEGFSAWSANTIRKIGIYAIPFQNADALRSAASAMGPLVSVIVRTKDRPALLSNALGSILAQTYANLEIVVVNDGSEDVEDLVLSLAGKTPVVYVRHERSRGRSAAANAGLDHARGVYFSFLDDNAWFASTHVSSLVKALEDDPTAAVAYAGVRTVSDKGAKGPGEEVIFNDPFNPVDLMGGNCIPIHGVLFARSLVLSGCRFDEQFEVDEDWDFLLQLSRWTRFKHVDQVSAVCRATCGSGIGLGAEADKVRRGREAVYKKWKGIWSAGELDALVSQLQARCRNLSGALTDKTSMIQDRDRVIREQGDLLKAVESEIRLIKNSRVWRIAELFRRLIYHKVIEKMPVGTRRGVDPGRRVLRRLFLRGQESPEVTQADRSLRNGSKE